MSARIVVDSTVLMTLITEEDGSVAIAEQLENAQMAAPTLLPFELVEGVCEAIKKDPDYADTYRQKLADLMALPNLRLFDIVFIEVMALSLSAKLSGYDASYLWLAKDLKLPLVTLDEKLQAAAAVTLSQN